MSGNGLIDQASSTNDELYRQSEEGNDPCGQAQRICHVELTMRIGGLRPQSLGDLTRLVLLDKYLAHAAPSLAASPPDDAGFENQSTGKQH